jgi:hypothetical protein
MPTTQGIGAPIGGQRVTSMPAATVPIMRFSALVSSRVLAEGSKALELLDGVEGNDQEADEEDNPHHRWTPGTREHQRSPITTPLPTTTSIGAAPAAASIRHDHDTGIATGREYGAARTSTSVNVQACHARAAYRVISHRGCLSLLGPNRR